MTTQLTDIPHAGVGDQAGGAQGTRPAGYTTSLCGCGATAEAIATDLPDQDGYVLFGDRPAHRVFCIPCLAAELDDDTSPWVDVAAIPGGGASTRCPAGGELT